jgi:TRAP-type C4-dicarboxylate transport system substrate-binding protein
MTGKKHVLVAALIVSLALIMVPLGWTSALQAEEAKPITLKMADSFPQSHPAYKMSQRLIQKIDEYTQGKVKIDYYPAEQLGKMKDLLDLCKLGVTDIAYVAPSFDAGKVPLNTIMILPYWTNAAEGTEIYQRLLKEAPELSREFSRYGVSPLAVLCISQYDIGTVQKEVRSPADAKGLRLKSSGGLYERIAKRYGISPVTIPSPEVYEGVQRGVVDGAIFSLPSVKGYRLNELEKYHTLGLRLGGYPATYVINDKVWQGLSPALQEGITRAAVESSKWFAKVWDGLQVQLAKAFEQGGMKIYYVTTKERSPWDEAVKGIEKEWIESVKGKAPSCEEVFNKFKKISEEVAQ